MSIQRRPRIGLALGSGVGRGWAHIGVIKALLELGVTPDIVCGTSIGALVGGFYVSGKLAELEDWACGLTKLSMVRFINLRAAKNGLIAANRIFAEMDRVLADTRIEDMDLPFASIATDLNTGQEVWLSDGNLVDAIKASFAVPTFFPPAHIGGRWLIDGALVNQVPVSVCRAFGADIVIAVNLSSREALRNGNGTPGKVSGKGGERPAPDEAPAAAGGHGRPSMIGIVASTLNIVQDRVTRGRLAAEPPDVHIMPKVAQIGLLDFYRADDLIAAGRNAVYLVEAQLDDLIESEGALVL